MFVTVVRREDSARTFVAGAVLLFHGVLFFALLWTDLGPRARPQARAPTIWLNLQADLQAIQRNRRERRRQLQRHQPAPSRSAPSRGIPVFLLPIEPNQQNLLGLHDQLFNCAPENLASLDDTQRSRCRKLGALPRYDGGSVDYADHSDEVPGAKRWKRELARKKAPLLLPCGNALGFNPIYTGTCILETVVTGFAFKKQYENQPGYFDKPKKVHVDNNGDPPPIYRDRDH